MSANSCNSKESIKLFYCVDDWHTSFNRDEDKKGFFYNENAFLSFTPNSISIIDLIQDKNTLCHLNKTFPLSNIINLTRIYIYILQLEWVCSLHQFPETRL